MMTLLLALENKDTLSILQHITFRMCTYLSKTKLLVAMRLGETPVHIPNTMVKP